MKEAFMKQNGISAPIRISGSNVDLGEDLPRKVREQILHVAESYFGSLNHAAVGFRRDGHWYCCTINIQVGNLKVMVSEASAADCQQAFDQALAKVSRQLLRRKQRIEGRKQVQLSAPAFA